jgi:hypothetical protein
LFETCFAVLVSVFQKKKKMKKKEDKTGNWESRYSENFVKLKYANRTKKQLISQTIFEEPSITFGESIPIVPKLGERKEWKTKG